MNRAVTWLSIVVALVIGGKYGLEYMFRSGEEHAAHERVREMLDGMKPGGDLQRSICLWYRGSRSLDQYEFNQGADAFDAWRAKKGVNLIKEYVIDAAVLVEGGEMLATGVVLVTGSMDGKRFAIRAIPREPLRWED